MNPSATGQKRVQLQGHNFFQPQPVLDADVYFIKSIIHDWSDDEALKILKQLRGAAGPQSRLFAMDKIVPYTCEAALTEMDGVTIVGPNSGLARLKGGVGNVMPHLSSVIVSIILLL